MIESAHFSVIGVPVSKLRHRKGRGGRMYTPQKTVDWENQVRLSAMPHAPDEPWEGPVTIGLFFYMPRPKRLKKSAVYHTKKPDIDNLEKAILDALSGLFYKGDQQVCEKTSFKEYVVGWEEPHVSIKIGRIK